MRDMAQVGLVFRPTFRYGSRKAMVLFTLCMGVLIAQVDTSVVNLAIHSIGSSFLASVTALQWVLDAYNLTYATFLLSGGLIPIFMAGGSPSSLARPLLPSPRSAALSRRRSAS